MNALYAERELCRAIADHGRDCLVRIKGNRPDAPAALAGGCGGGELSGPETESVGKSGCDRAAAHRTGEGLAGYIREEMGFPGDMQAVMVEKERVDIAAGEVSRERRRLLTGLSSRRRAPKELLRAVRNHRGTGNSLHHVKDRSWTRTCTRCAVRAWVEVYASLANTGLNALRLEVLFPKATSISLKARTCAFRPKQTSPASMARLPDFGIVLLRPASSCPPVTGVIS